MAYVENITCAIDLDVDKHFYIKSDDTFIFELIITPNNLIRRYRVSGSTVIHSFADDYDYDIGGLLIWETRGKLDKKSMEQLFTGNMRYTFYHSLHDVDITFIYVNGMLSIDLVEGCDETTCQKILHLLCFDETDSMLIKDLLLNLCF